MLGRAGQFADALGARVTTVIVLGGSIDPFLPVRTPTRRP
jgi:hypothetical protein